MLFFFLYLIISSQVCNDVHTPREVCNDIPDEVCRSVPATITKYEDEENCSNVSGRKCSPATRQECENIKENVPRQTFEERCNTEYVEECTTSGN